MERKLKTIDLYVSTAQNYIDQTVKIMNNNKAFKNKNIYLPAYLDQLIIIAVVIFGVGILAIIIGWFIHDVLLDCVGRNKSL